MYGSCPDFVRFREKIFGVPFFVIVAIVILDIQKIVNGKPGRYAGQWTG
jgi:hypothetical protein